MLVAAIYAVAVAFLGGCAVDDEREAVEALGVVDFVDEADVAGCCVVGAADVYSGVCEAVESECVADHTDWSGIDDDVVVNSTCCGKELLEAVRSEEFAGIGGHRAGADNVKVLNLGGMHDDAVEGHIGRCEVLGEAEGGIDAEVGGKAGLADVEADKEYLLAEDGERSREVHGNEALALTGVGGRDENDFLVAVVEDELEVRAEEAEELGSGRSVARTYDKIVSGAILADFTEDGNVGVLAQRGDGIELVV